MPGTLISSTDYTDALGVDYSQTAANANIADYPNAYEATSEDTDGSTGQKEYMWSNENWTKYLGYYKQIPQTASAIDKIGLWTVGQGFSFTGGAIKRFLAGKKFGIGKDSFTTILYNLDRTGQIAGDCFAEIIKDKSGRLINLKPLNPGTITIVVDSKGMIKRYEQNARQSQKSVPVKFKPEDIFHIAFNRIADEIHGISSFERLLASINMKEEARKDLKVVFHRYVKPLLISEVDTDDPAEIAAFKSKIDSAVQNGENMIIPKGIATVNRVSIPQFSTLDPIPWIRNLSRELVIAQGVPQVILGSSSEEDTEASSKIVYLAFEQMIKFRQMVWEEELLKQLNLKIKLNFPASIQPDLLNDNNKDGSSQKPDKVDPSKQGQ